MLTPPSFPMPEEFVLIGEPLWLRQKRHTAYTSFCELPLPNFRYGMTVRMDISALKIEEIGPIEAAESSKDEAVVSHIPDGIIVQSLNDALQKYPELMERYLFSLFDSMSHKFAAMHGAFVHHGLFVYVPKGVLVTEPLVIEHSEKNKDSFYHTLIVAEEGSSVHILERLHAASSQSQAFSSNGTEIIVKKGAQVTFGSIQDYPSDRFCFDYKLGSVERDGLLTWVDICFGSRFTKSENKTQLIGIGSSCMTRHLFFGTGEQQFDLGASAVHVAPRTKSVLRGRGVLDGKAKNIYRGVIHIQRSAPGSDGYQKQDTLLLNPSAEADSIPQLQIDNNDVKCGHGATVGQVDKEKLFYLMSRGLSEQAARKIVVLGYFESLVFDIPLPGIAEEVRSLVEQRVL